MLQEGDRVLVCLSGSSSTLCLLHLLRQFCQTRRLKVQLAAVTVGSADSGVDPRALMLYLKELDVPYFYEPLGRCRSSPCAPVCNDHLPFFSHHIHTHTHTLIICSFTRITYRSADAPRSPPAVQRAGNGQHTRQAGRSVPHLAAPPG